MGALEHFQLRRPAFHFQLGHMSAYHAGQGFGHVQVSKALEHLPFDPASYQEAAACMVCKPRLSISPDSNLR